jgi:hypothetical protein
MRLTMDASDIATAEEVAAAEESTAEASNESQPAAPGTAPADDKLDTMGFELALQFQDVESEGFEAAVAAAVDSVGGELLFDMPMPAETDCQRVAAVAIGAGENRLLMLVTMPSEGDTLRVETVEQSSHPVAGIVAAYAGLMDHLAVAA